jgi:hypothetical protein
MKLRTVRNESLIAALELRMSNLENRLDSLIQTLDRDLRDWVKVIMQHNSDIARLKDKAGLD